MKKLILIVLIILFSIFYLSIFAIKEKRIKEMCESYKKSAGVEGCTLQYYQSSTLEDFEALYEKMD